MVVTKKMNYKGKKMMIDSLTKLVESSPARKKSPYTPYIQWNQMLGVTQQEYDTWINYVNGVLDILYDYAGLEIIALTKIKIAKIPIQNNSTYYQYAFLVERELLDLAQNILSYQ